MHYHHLLRSPLGPLIPLLDRPRRLAPMEVMNPFNFQLLAPGPPSGFGAPAFYCGASALQHPTHTNVDLDRYLRSIGALPPLPMVASASSNYTTPPAYGGSLVDTLSVQLPATCELYDAALDAHVQADAAVDVHPPRAAAKFSDGAVSCSKNKNKKAAASTRPEMCAPYDADIDASLRAMEKDATERPTPDYLVTTQGGRISMWTRVKLVDAMSGFARDFQLAPETLHRAVSYVDRFLSVKAVSPDGRQLYLLGAVALFVAGKYDDQSTLRKINALVVAWCCGFSTSKEVLAMESAMVAALDYELSGPTAYTFLEHFMRHNMGDDELDLQVQQLAHHLTEQSLLHYAFVRYMPSTVAASAIFLARMQALSPQERPWSKEFEELTGYKVMDLMDCVNSMYLLITCPSFQLEEVHFEAVS